MATDKVEVELVKIISSRLREARGLCKFTQAKGAGLLGLKTESLRRIERALDIERISLKLILRASEVYDVSIDFLYGESDDWERDPVVSQERQVGGWIHKIHIEQLSKLSVCLIKQKKQLGCVSQAAEELLNAVTGIGDALNRFQELNNEFIDMRGGATLVSQTKAASTLAHELRLKLIRCKAISLKTEERHGKNN